MRLQPWTTLLLSAVAWPSAAVHPESSVLLPALAEDDDCHARGGEETCALSALQLKGRKVSAVDRLKRVVRDKSRREEGPSYDVGEEDTSSCPAGSEYLDLEPECKAAAKWFNWTFEGTVAWPGVPPFCYISWEMDEGKEEGIKVWFNALDDSEGHETNAASLCVRFFYVLGNEDNSTCPESSQYIHSEEGCEAAADWYEVPFEGTIAWPGVPPYCYVHFDGQKGHSVWFNALDDSTGHEKNTSTICIKT